MLQGSDDIGSKPLLDGLDKPTPQKQQQQQQTHKVCHLAQQNTPIPPPPHCEPSDTVSKTRSATVSVCPLCCIWFAYYQ